MRKTKKPRTAGKYYQGGGNFITNGTILGVVSVLLSVYISTNSLWSIATVVVIALLVSLSGFQFWLFYYFFHKNK